MFNVNNEPEGIEATVCDGCSRVPLTHLALDLQEPLGGWKETLEARGVELLEDDLGRPAVSREDARRLMGERREWELRNAEEARRRRDSRKTSPVLPGIPRPRDGDPALSAFEVMRAADLEAEQSDPSRRISPAAEFLTQRLGRPRKVEVKEK